MAAKSRSRKRASKYAIKVVHVSNTDLMGRRFNGYDLLTELKSRGVSGRQAVIDKQSRSGAVIPLFSTPEELAHHYALEQEERRHSMDNLLFPWGRALLEMPDFRKCDLVHFHLIHNHVISLFDLPDITSAKPCVWTFHDPWIMTGHCIYPRDCDRWLTGCRVCPHLDYVFAMQDDCATDMWKIKRNALAELDIDIVVASEFMLDMVQRSPLTRHLKNVHLIPFGVEPKTFLPDDLQAASRRELGIPQDDFVILFRATPSEVKGVDYILRALSSQPPARSTTVLTVDQTGMASVLRDHYNVVELGWVDESRDVGRAFSACDVLLMPSLAEAFGLMALEAMAAGRPVICFEGTSLPGVTHAPDCGIAVPMGDSEALRSAIDELAADSEDARRRGQLARNLVRQRYSHDQYLDSIAALYSKVVQRHRGGSAGARAGSGGQSVSSSGAHTASGRPLEGARVCLVFEFDLTHHTRYRREIAALQEAGASVRLLTSHLEVGDVPDGVQVDVSPLDGLGLPPAASLGLLDRREALRHLRDHVDVFWVSDYLGLPTVLEAVDGYGSKVVYETVDLVPEYPHQGEAHRAHQLEGERDAMGRIDGFITACDSYADYYMERYSDLLTRRPTVCDNTPGHSISHVRPTSWPLRLVFFGNLMFDRPVHELIEAMALTTADVTLTFQGRNLIGHAPLARIAQLGLEDRVSVIEPCPPEAVVDVAAGYDVGIVALRGDDENERRACTSKLFTCMSAGLAVLGSDLPGIAGVIAKHGNGLLVQGMDPTQWAASFTAIASMTAAEIDAMKQRSLDASAEYSWERQKPAFVGEFARALGRDV